MKRKSNKNGQTPHRPEIPKRKDFANDLLWSEAVLDWTKQLMLDLDDAIKPYGIIPLDEKISSTKKKIQLTLSQRQLSQLIKNTWKFDSEYPIECRRETGTRFLFVNESHLRELRRVRLN